MLKTKVTFKKLDFSIRPQIIRAQSNDNQAVSAVKHAANMAELKDVCVIPAGVHPVLNAGTDNHSGMFWLTIQLKVESLRVCVGSTSFKTTNCCDVGAHSGERSHWKLQLRH